MHWNARRSEVAVNSLQTLHPTLEAVPRKIATRFEAAPTQTLTATLLP
jgi:hypothetical protein